MSTTTGDTNLERRWQTYLTAIIFAVPAAIAWGFACVFLVPKLREILEGSISTAQFEPSTLGWLWFVFLFSLFLVEHIRLICIVLILILVLLELFVRGWRRYRRVTLSILVWVFNVAAIFSLTVWLVLAVAAGASLARTQLP